MKNTFKSLLIILKVRLKIIALSTILVMRKLMQKFHRNQLLKARKEQLQIITKQGLISTQMKKQRKENLRLVMQ